MQMVCGALKLNLTLFFYEYPGLEINDLHLIHNRDQAGAKREVARICFGIIISVCDRFKLNNERMCNTTLSNHKHHLRALWLSNFTCIPSTEQS